ncbi:MAG: hypothetical protein A3H91_16630 [Gammaproteobacteria bacterium RIFCSPLOWO2_02_FULL_61_13]|nr:MAG: hypothetical protein A3H91_16630 [Gammaproteobacteria bacterium RIFCSPLOWO2_02_FULL_61_13]
MAKRRQSRRTDDPIDFGMLPDLAGYRIRLAQIAIFRDFVASMQASCVTPTQFGALVLMEANPGIRQLDLARALQLDRSSVVPLLERLEKRGLVARERLRQDRRSNALHLTAKGLRLLQEVKPRVLDHERRLSASLSTEDRAALARSLALIFPERQKNNKTN